MAGFVGPTCLINVDDCEMRPCANGGHCTDLINDFLCQCEPGWTGKDCSVNVDNCLTQPCQHGGICHDRIDDYECQCPEGFWGKDCHLYEGMSTTPSPLSTSNVVSETIQPPAFGPSTTEDILHQLGNSSGQGSSSLEDGLTMPQMLIVVCLGAGLPILLIIILVVILLCRKHHSLVNNSMEKECHQNYINNMNNRGDNYGKDAKYMEDGSDGSGSGGVGSVNALAAAGKMDSKLEASTAAMIFTTPFPQHVPPMLPSTASVVKISNEEQQDINQLNAQQHRASRDKNASKNFIRDSLGHEPPYPSPSPTPTLLSHRDSRVYDYEKPIRRLDVDTLSEDTKVDIRYVSRLLVLQLHVSCVSFLSCLSPVSIG